MFLVGSFCGYGLPSQDLVNSLPESFEACVEDCPARSPYCTSVVWSESEKRCGRRGAATSIKDFRSDSAYISALASKSQLDKSIHRVVCPAPNLSIQRSASGRQYKIRCGSWFGASENLLEMRHASTLDECMDYCDQLRPLCSRVNLNSDLLNLGWMNCELKNVTAQRPSSYTRTMGHTAEALTVTLPRERCNHNSTRTASDGRQFRVSCNDQRPLNYSAVPLMRRAHDTSVGGCLQRCADVNFTCNAAVFDVSLQSGYQNCYLFENMPPTGEYNSDYTFAYLDIMSAQYSPPPPKVSSEKNQKWIAGAVLGPTGAFVAAGLLWWYILRRSKAKAKAS
jgi:hypothetical protein